MLHMNFKLNYNILIYYVTGFAECPNNCDVCYRDDDAELKCATCADGYALTTENLCACEFSLYQLQLDAKY